MSNPFLQSIPSDNEPGKWEGNGGECGFKMSLILLVYSNTYNFPPARLELIVFYL